MTSVLLKNIEIQNPFVDSFMSDILIKDNKIVEISDNITVNADKTINADNLIITPGMIDRHTHGGYGCNFNTCNEEELQNYLTNAKNHGIVAVLPTIMTDSIENINRQIQLIKSVKSKGAKILGIHLEGPFINPNKKGIHPEEHILPLTVDNLNKIDTDFIRVMTYAPELDKNGDFLKELLKRNIIPSIGHSDCTYDEAMFAIKNGAKQITHAFNAIRGIHHREPSVMTVALMNDDVSTEIIADLQHVHKAVVEMLLKLKPQNRVLFISDALPITYTSQTEAIFGEEKIFYNGQKATSADGVLAGSTMFLDDICNSVKDFVSFKDFIGYTTKNIAESINYKDFTEIITENSKDYIFWDKMTYKVVNNIIN